MERPVNLRCLLLVLGLFLGAPFSCHAAQCMKKVAGGGPRENSKKNYGAQGRVSNLGVVLLALGFHVSGLDHRRLLALALLLNLGGCQAIRCKYANSDPAMGPTRGRDKECGEKGCLVVTAKQYLVGPEDCALPPGDMKCLLEQSKEKRLMGHMGNCLFGQYAAWRFLLKLCTNQSVAHDPGLSGPYVEVCYCYDKDVWCNFGHKCKCDSGMEWGGKPPSSPPTAPPLTPEVLDIAEIIGRASTVSVGGVHVVALGTLMTLYAWDSA